MHYKYLILGNGIAGHAAAKEIRKNDPEGSIALIGNEGYPTYFRIKLTELIRSDIDDSLYLGKQEEYDRLKIDLFLNTEVAKVDFEKKSLKTCEDEEFTWDKLLITTGASSFVPPIPGVEKKNIMTIRSLDDLKDFKNALEKAEDVTVIGGGLLGLEAAYSIHQTGKKVHIIETFDHLLGRQLNTEEGRKVEEALKKMGMDVHCGKNTSQFLGQDQVSGIELADGSQIKSELVLLSTGVRPNLGLFKNSDLEIDRGIKVDPTMKTNLPDVYAAGDCAQFGNVVLGLWTASMENGKIAGYNLSADGPAKTYETPKNFTELSIGDIKVFSVGQTGDELVVYGEDTPEYELRVFVQDGKLVGGILSGNTKEKTKLKNAVFNHLSIDEFKKEFPNLKA